MNFTRISEWCLQSDCGRYTVARTGPKGEHKYMAYTTAKNVVEPQIGGPYTNSSDAKDACIRHKTNPSGVARNDRS
jgi:hypothetical protein